MAKVRLNPIMEQVRGQVGDLVFRRFGDEVVMSRKPNTEGRVWTEAQMAQREQFRQAALYGKMVIADPQAKAVYEAEAQARGVPVFSVMVADFFNAPSVDEIDVSGYAGKVGDPIIVRASDDFEVTGVTVVMSTGDGQAVELGAAVETPAKSGRWMYTATQAVPAGTAVRIAVTATDRPGHKTTKEQSKG